MKTMVACCVVALALGLGGGVGATTGGDFTDWGTYDDYGDTQLPPAVRQDRAQVRVLRDRYQRGTLSSTALCAALADPATLPELRVPHHLVQALIEEQHIVCPPSVQGHTETRGQL